MRIRKFNEEFETELDTVYIKDCFESAFEDLINNEDEDIRVDLRVAEQEKESEAYGKWVSITIGNAFVNPSKFSTNSAEVMSDENKEDYQTTLDKFIEISNKKNEILQRVKRALDLIKIEYSDYRIKSEMLSSMFISIFPSKYSSRFV